jgi:hypothetical protein
MEPIITDEPTQVVGVGPLRAAAKMRNPLCIGVVALASAVACVHTGFERTGRLRLDNGSEGAAPVFAVIPDGYEEVATVSVHADSLGTAERLERHLLRRANLMGCAGVVDVVVQAHRAAQATCVQRRELPEAGAAAIVAVREPSLELMARAQSGGDAGAALLSVLDSVATRPARERAWPLQWYLATYPNSPYAADVDAMLVREVAGGGGSTASVRMAPSAP